MFSKVLEHGDVSVLLGLHVHEVGVDVSEPPLKHRAKEKVALLYSAFSSFCFPDLSLHWFTSLLTLVKSNPPILRRVSLSVLCVARGATPKEGVGLKGLFKCEFIIP